MPEHDEGVSPSSAPPERCAARGVTHRTSWASEEPFRLLVNSVHDYAVFLLDPAGRIVSWNAGAERIKGYAAEEIIGKHYSLFYPPAEIALGIPTKNLEVAASDGQYQEEGWRVRKDGRLFWAQVAITALWDQERRLIGFGR